MNIPKIVNRFLSWKLPADFAPDCGVRFFPPERDWPTGTNLLTAAQADAMFRYVLAAEPATLAAQQPAASAEQWRSLYRRAVNEANGLTNYVEDRPELRKAERNLTAIEAEARALAAAPAVQQDGMAHNVRANPAP